MWMKSLEWSDYLIDTSRKLHGIVWIGWLHLVHEIRHVEAEQSSNIKTVVQRQEKEAAERAAAVSHMSLGAAGVWGSAMSNLSWASRASSVGMTAASHQSSQQVGCGGPLARASDLWVAALVEDGRRGRAEVLVWNSKLFCYVYMLYWISFGSIYINLFYF